MISLVCAGSLAKTGRGVNVEMPANLPPQYSKVEEELRKAVVPAERLEKLRELFRLLPKHKGTEKLQSDLKQKISRAKEDLEGARGGGKKKGISHRVPHEGAGQVVLVGGSNVGKSALLSALTNAKPEVAPYPYSTRTPLPGMMSYLDVRVQLVDLPAVTEDYLEPWLPDLIRSADAALLVADLGNDDLIDQVEAALTRLSHASIVLYGQEKPNTEDESIQNLRTLVVANKSDAPDARERRELLEDWFASRFSVLPVSVENGEGLDELSRATYDLLGVMRVYTKRPGKPADLTTPFTIPIGGTVFDLAREIHRDFEHSLKFAKVWGSGVFDGQTVKRDHELHEADVVELHL